MRLIVLLGRRLRLRDALPAVVHGPRFSPRPLVLRVAPIAVQRSDFVSQVHRLSTPEHTSNICACDPQTDWSSVVRFSCDAVPQIVPCAALGAIF